VLPQCFKSCSKLQTLKPIIIPSVVEIIAISNKTNFVVVSLVNIFSEVGVVIIDANVIAKISIRTKTIDTSSVIITRRKRLIFEFNL
jgi:hypothetical protein